MNKRKWLSILLCLVMVFTCVSPVFADTATTWTAEDFTYGTETFELYPAGETSKKITVDAYVITGLSEAGKTKLETNKDLVIPATDADGKKIQGVGKDAFNKAYIESLKLPENVKTAYDDSTWQTTGKGLTERGDFFIGYGAFRYNNLTTLELPEGVIYIDTYAFANNTLMTSVTFPETIQQIRSGAFYKDPLTCADFPGKTDFALQMDAQVFMGCKLKTVQLPSNIEKMHKWTFIQNTGMEPITSGTAAEKNGGVVYLYVESIAGMGGYVEQNTVVHKFFEGKDPNKVTNLSDKATLEYTEVEYTGSALTPAVTIEGLTLDTDYTVEYKNNTEVGTATAVVVGTGDYYGSIELTYTIKAAAPVVDGGEGETEPDKEVPKTGDQAPIELMMGLMVLAAAGAYVGYRKSYTK